jgi:hypothetical protein
VPLPQNEHKEKIILKLLKDRNVKDETIKAYQDMMVIHYKSIHSAEKFPQRVVANLPELGLTEPKIKELMGHEGALNTSPLNQYVVIELRSALPQSQPPPAVPSAVGPMMPPANVPIPLSIPTQHSPLPMSYRFGNMESQSRSPNMLNFPVFDSYNSPWNIFTNQLCFNPSARPYMLPASYISVTESMVQYPAPTLKPSQPQMSPKPSTVLPPLPPLMEPEKKVKMPT